MKSAKIQRSKVFLITFNSLEFTEKISLKWPEMNRCAIYNPGELALFCAFLFYLKAFLKYVENVFEHEYQKCCSSLP